MQQKINAQPGSLTCYVFLFKNGAEHPRWINRNWEDIDTTLKRCVNGNAYEIRLPEKERAQEFDFLGNYCQDSLQFCAVSEKLSFENG